jgi:hypothetical protein
MVDIVYYYRFFLTVDFIAVVIYPDFIAVVSYPDFISVVRYPP